MAASARRCSECATNWPYLPAYIACPLCEVETWHCVDDTPLTDQEARQIVAAQRDRLARSEAVERQMDAAFDGWFLRKHGIAPWNEPAKNGQTMAPLSEFLPL